MFGIHSRIRLTHKIAAIGAVGVVGVIALGAIYHVGSSTQDYYREVAERAQAALTQASALQVKLLESRRAEKDFLLDNDMRHAERHGALNNEIRAGTEGLRQQAAAAGLRDLQKIDAISAGFSKYRTHFLAVVDAKQRLGFNENSGLEGALRKSGAALETRLNQLKVQQLLMALQMLRRHENDFMLRRDPRSGKEFKTRGGDLTAALENIDFAEGVNDDIKRKLSDYERDFFAFIDGALKLASEQKSTSDAYAEIEPAIDALLRAMSAAETQADNANQESRAHTKLQMQLAILLIAIAACGFAFWIGRLVTRPISGMTNAMGELAAGNLNVELPDVNRKDEIGQMARAVVVFRDSGLEKVRLEADAAEQRQMAEQERARKDEFQRQAAAELARVVRSIAEGLQGLARGDLTCRLSGQFPEAYEQIRQDFNLAITELHDTVQAITAATSDVEHTAGEVSASTTDLSHRTEEQAASLEETSAAMDRISATSKRSAENAQHASQIAVTAREVADRGGEVVTQAVRAMAEIAESSRKVSDIIGVIDEIARQTNLLALNAAVEAARAGEAGRGFAVVASEVRNLAQRSSQAAKDIADLITSSTAQVESGVELVNRAGASLTDIVDSIRKVVQIVSEISAASVEQSSGIDQINSAVAQMDELTQQNTALVEQNASSVKALEHQSQAMSERIRFFQVDTSVDGANTARAA
jgi:methyl-accepting chemotaxis protein